ncbi:SIS domain-containing protein [Caldilinea sp.]|uniref:SIS domain-containing protein n=1 Tax=Caldilinea sp. TaxID=2293560 RepID=UPI002C9CF5B5|nr:SIS domain-containing protein [Caldilinea sp.]
MTDHEMLELGREVVRAEAAAIEAVAEQLDPAFVAAARLVAGCPGVILTTGSGTSGTIARRLAHLLATCGMHAFFVHPADALHGPSAAVAPGDVLIALSKAGKSAEINHFARVARQRGGQVISLTWKPDSELAELSDVVLVQPNAVEAEGEGVLPFGSTLAAGALCDALCLAVKTMRGFDLATLTQTHPSGATAELVKK